MKLPGAERLQRAGADALPMAAAALLDVAARLRAGIDREPRQRRRAWFAVVAVLTAGPVVFTLARSDSFAASVELFPQRVGPYPPVFDPSYYHAFLSDPELRREMLRNVGAVPTDVAFARARDVRAIRMTVRAGQPRRAAVLANALGPQMANATRRELIAAIPRDLATSRRMLRSGMLDAAERRRMALRIRLLRRIPETPPPRVSLGPAAEPPQLTRSADRIADALPGEMPRPPGLLGAAVSGLLLAATLWALALVLFPPRTRRP